MIRYRKIINLTGRYKFVREACEDIYDHALNLPSLEGRIQVLHSNPTNHRLSLDPYVNFYKTSMTAQPRLIIHCYPYTTYKNLQDLNNYVNKESLNVFTNINLFVHEPYIIDEFKQEILGRRTVYNDLYCISEPYETKQKRIQKYLDMNHEIV